ncbi:hypothetical protein [Algibacter mikhailovii]|uniref:hypothetical protein n=1 Tax=Algibacter mikhailovii TaxID=425498 RepID=UPI002494DDD9|nr:hypothetical protein [Algibacter mikhailovii]
MKTQLLIILAIIICSCKSEKEQSTIDWKIPIVKDSLPIANKYFETKKIRNPFNQLLFIGAKEDSILITKNSLNRNLYYPEFIEVNDSVNKKSEIEIIVDLNQELSIDFEKHSFPPAPPASEPPIYVKAYPVFIRNITQDTVHIDNQDGELFLIQEAKNKFGEWKPIEYWIYASCGNSYSYTSLGPNDILILKKAKYQGTFETDMRLKLRTNDKIVYSKPFKGSLNIEQFDLDNLDGFTKRGLKNRDEEYIDQILLNK